MTGSVEPKGTMTIRRQQPPRDPGTVPPKPIRSDALRIQATNTDTRDACLRDFDTSQIGVQPYGQHIYLTAPLAKCDKRI